MKEATMDLGELTNALVLKIEGWVVDAVRLLPNAFIALLVVLASLLVARAIDRFVRRYVARTSANAQIAHLGASIARLAVFAAGLSIALSVLGLDKAVTSLLAGVGVLGIVLGFALQESSANFVAGVMMAVRQPFKIGEIVRTGEYLGVVEAIDLRATTLRQFSGERVIVPNKDVFGRAIENYSSYGQRRIDVTLGVAYGSDLGRATEVALAAAAAIPGRKPERPPEVLFTGFGDSSVDFVVRVWADYPSNGEWLGVQSDLVKALHAAFGEAGITMPYPTRTIEFRS